MSTPPIRPPTSIAPVISPVAPVGPAGRRGAAPFAPIPPAAAPHAPPSVGAAAATAGVFALQFEPFSPARAAARAAAKGGRALDALADLARALAGGGDLDAAREALAAATVDPDEAPEPGLRAILAEIETRRAVEAAKLERFQPTRS